MAIGLGTSGTHERRVAPVPPVVPIPIVWPAAHSERGIKRLWPTHACPRGNPPDCASDGRAGDASWGLSSLDVEALTKLPADTAFWYWTTDTVADPVTPTLAKTAVWQRLPFVTAKRVEPIAGGVWLYGGPASMMQLVDAYVAAVR